MYKRLLLVMVIGLPGVLSLRAQVTMVLQVPPAGVMQKSQLWNMALVYAGDGGLSVTVGLTLLSVKDNQPVMTAVSRPLFLNKGTNQINARELSPIQYNYLSPLFNVDRDPNGFLPVGNYKACYTVSANTHSQGPLAEDCLPVEVQPLSPLQLNLPADTSVLETAYPQFTWLPPMPLNLFSDLNYDMMIVEVLPGQGSYEAIQQNVPVYNISHYRDQVHLYPASGKALDTGRVYAWRVAAKNEEDLVSQSEVWTFRLAAKKPVALVPLNGNYIQVRKSNEPSAGLSAILGEVIGIRYYSPEKEHLATVRFLSADGKEVRVVQQNIVYGDNFLGYEAGRSFQKGMVYQVEIVDGQKNKYTASFILK